MTVKYRIYLRSEILGSEGPDWVQIQVQIQGQIQDPDPGPDWSPDRLLRISYLRYTGLEALVLASDNLRLPGPRIG